MARLLVCTLLLLRAAEAWGHAEILRVEPADGAVLRDAPNEIIVRFSEDVTPLRVTLIDAHQEPLVITHERVVSETLRVTPPPLTDGLYLFSFRVTSADGHPIARTIAFRVGEGEPASFVGAAGEADGAYQQASLILRAVSTLLVLLCAGMFLYRLVVAGADSRVERPLQNFTLVAVLLSLALYLPAFSGAGLGVYADAAALGQLLPQKAVIGQLLFAAGFLAFVPASRTGRDVVAIAALVAIGLGKVSAGHTATADFPPLPSILLFAHMSIVAFWLGSLLYLYRATRTRAPELHSQLQRFSAVALPAVVLLIVTGTAMAWLIVDGWRSLVDERYGQLLVLKILLVAAVCALAVVNKQLLTPKLARGEETAVGKLRASIRVELVLLLAAIAVTSVLAVTMPSTQASTAVPPWTRAQFVSADYALRIYYEPAPGGALEITALHGDVMIDAMEMRMRWRDTAGNIEAIDRHADKTDGKFVSTLPELPIETWLLEVEVLIDDFTSVRINGELSLR